MNELATRAETAPALPDAADAPAVPAKRPNPLRQLPKEWRPAVSFFYAAYSDLLKSPLGLVTRLRYCVEADGLSFDEVKAVFKWAMEPAQQARFEYAGQLLAGIAGRITELLAARKQAAAMREMKERSKESEANRAKVSNLSSLFGAKPDAKG